MVGAGSAGEPKFNPREPEVPFQERAGDMTVLMRAAKGLAWVVVMAVLLICLAILIYLYTAMGLHPGLSIASSGELDDPSSPMHIVVFRT